MPDEKILYKKISYKLVGCFYEVYNILGPGHKEDVYYKALTKEFKLRSIEYATKKRLKIDYKGDTVGVYEPDFIIENKIITPTPESPAIYGGDEWLSGSEFRPDGRLRRFSRSPDRIVGKRRNSYRKKPRDLSRGVFTEIKSALSMPNVYEKQLFYYLKGTGYKLGYLVNFGSDKIDIRRRIL